jgi:cysteine-rich repeat protein
MTKSTAKFLLGLGCAIATGCGESSPKIDLPSETSGAAVQGDDTDTDTMMRNADCDGAPNGTPCAAAGHRMHCLFDACVRNACGDGVPAFGEECDDGDEIDGDGCNSHCKLEVAPGCGNGVREPGEDCDDGNTDDGDACTADCSDPVCGDGIVSTGEECDDGNRTNGDTCTARCQLPSALCGNGMQDDAEACDDGNMVAGDGCENDCTLTPIESSGGGSGGASAGTGGNGGDAGTSGGSGGMGGGSGGMDTGTGGMDTGTGGMGSGTGGMDTDTGGMGGGPSPECEACRNANCTAYQGVDFVAGCFDLGANGETARGGFSATFTAAQVQTCVDALTCAEANGCGHVLGAIANDCYCGAFHSGFGLDECIASGPEGAPPCRRQWEAASGQTTPSLVLGAISDLSTPVGWAYFILECEATYCDAPGSDCTP